MVNSDLTVGSGGCGERGGSGRLLDGSSPDGGEHVSIVTVVRNAAAALDRTLSSVLAQQNQHVEYIVVDGASTDGTLALLRNAGDTITTWVSEPDHGIYDAMNKGIGLATGMLIKLLNADDLLLPGAIDAALETLDTDERCVIASEMEVADEEGRVYATTRSGIHQWPIPVFNHPSWFVPKAIYDEVGLYDSVLRISADHDWFRRACGLGIPFRSTRQPLVRFRRGGASGGFTGLSESWRINRRYGGLHQALLVLAYRSGQKVRYHVLQRTLGARNYAMLRRVLRSPRRLVEEVGYRLRG